MDQIHYNIDLVKPGVSFREFSETAWRIPNAYVANRYSCVFHGVGMCDEWPKAAHVQDLEWNPATPDRLHERTTAVEGDQANLVPAIPQRGQQDRPLPLGATGGKIRPDEQDLHCVSTSS